MNSCLTCGAPSPGSYCAQHSRKPASYAERKLSVDMRAEWIARYGLTCPGWEKRPGHAIAQASDLTLDHVVPVALGGREGAVRVMCRSCNSARKKYIAGR